MATPTGESETLLGAALRSRRDEVVIATKVGFRTGPALGRRGSSRRHILWSVDQSLRRLGTDWIDVYIAHKEDPFTPLEETLDAFDAVVRAGKVRYLGFSNWSAWKVAAAMEIQRARGLAPFTHGQMHYSLVGRDVERDVVPMMARYGLGMTVWSPLASGFLSGNTHGRTCRIPTTACPASTSCPSTRTRLRAGRAHAGDGGRARRKRRAVGDCLAAGEALRHERAAWCQQAASADRQSRRGGGEALGGGGGRARRTHHTV
jgi:aryl-alcohol dehydrogenase-like predicted oxidoreductase